MLTIGTRFRALSGVPSNALARALPLRPERVVPACRAASSAAPSFEHGVDLHVGYRAQALGKTTHRELYVDIFNVYNRQGTFNVDDTYAPVRRAAIGGEQNANPVSGGTLRGPDLGEDDRQERQRDEHADAAQPELRTTRSARYAPASAQVGLPRDVLAARRARSHDLPFRERTTFNVFARYADLLSHGPP